MKNILIIGDSWGVPNYCKEWNTRPEIHTEYQLKRLGYNVFNYSLNGGSMIETIEYARLGLQGIVSKFEKKQSIDEKNLRFLESLRYKRNTYSKGAEITEIPTPDYRNQKIDWILWFHTESIREQLSPQQTPWVRLKEIHDFFLHAVYRSFIDLVSMCPDVKTAIIGGQAPVDKLLYSYHKPNFIIEDWRSELVGEKLPFCHSISRLDVVETTFDDKDQKIAVMDMHDKIYKAMLNEELFFDRCHPGAKPHTALSIKLHQVFQSV